MLIAPLVDGQRLIGVIQVFSAWPNAFGKREISALQVLAGRIAESNRQAEVGLLVPVENPEPQPEAERIKAEPIEIEPAQIDSTLVDPTLAEEAEEVYARETSPRTPIDVWGIVLVLLVVAAALALGLVIGWRRAAEVTKNAVHVKASTPANTPSSAETVPAMSQNPTASDSTATANLAAKSTPRPVLPTGGLIVTQNGRVIYRSPSDAGQPAASDRAERSLIHRVDPQYPAGARAQHIQGPVVLDIQVLGDGAVGNVAVVSGDPLLTQSAIDAVKQWRYQPESVNGQAIESQTRITVKFTLPES
jgi:TonB family protein